MAFGLQALMREMMINCLFLWETSLACIKMRARLEHDNCWQKSHRLQLVDRQKRLLSHQIQLISQQKTPLSVEQVTLDWSSWMYFDPEFHSFLEKQFRRKLSFEQVCDILEEQAIPVVDALCVPTLDPSVIKHIPSYGKKFVQECNKELSVNQRAVLNTLCSFHNHLENNVAINPVDLKCVVEQILCLLGSANTQLSILHWMKVLANVTKTKIDLAHAKKWLFGDDSL